MKLLNSTLETIQRERMQNRVRFVLDFIVPIIIGAGAYFWTRNILIAVGWGLGIFIGIRLYFYFKAKLEASSRIKRIEDVFPDFIELMASNLRAGMTIDKALLLSSRKEFAPLDTEILNLGKDILTGKEIGLALRTMADRIQSDKIRKTIDLIITGIVSGGNLSILLEETAIHMRERGFVEKKASSNVLMYVIFIFFAVAIGAPVLFGLSAVLVQILTTILATIPVQSESAGRLPFTLTKITVSINFVVYFSLIFLMVTDVLAALVLGLVNKGEEKEGVKYIIPLWIVSISLFFGVRFVLSRYLLGLFG